MLTIDSDMNTATSTGIALNNEIRHKVFNLLANKCRPIQDPIAKSITVPMVTRVAVSEATPIDTPAIT